MNDTFDGDQAVVEDSEAFRLRTGLDLREGDTVILQCARGTCAEAYTIPLDLTKYGDDPRCPACGADMGDICMPVEGTFPKYDLEQRANPSAREVAELEAFARGELGVEVLYACSPGLADFD